jgi:hypothetical protein
VDRAVQGETFDVSYLTSLSADAVPALTAAYQTPSLLASVKEGVGAALACYAANQNHDSSPSPWQSFHFSRANAARLLMSLDGDLDQYQINDGDWSYSVVTPSGEEYHCNTFFD